VGVLRYVRAVLVFGFEVAATAVKKFSTKSQRVFPKKRKAGARPAFLKAEKPTAES
jgi:hypothetical protein